MYYFRKLLQGQCYFDGKIYSECYKLGAKICNTVLLSMTCDVKNSRIQFQKKKKTSFQVNFSHFMRFFFLFNS